MILLVKMLIFSECNSTPVIPSTSRCLQQQAASLIRLLVSMTQLAMKLAELALISQLVEVSKLQPLPRQPVVLSISVYLDFQRVNQNHSEPL